MCECVREDTTQFFLECPLIWYIAQCPAWWYYKPKQQCENNITVLLNGYNALNKN